MENKKFETNIANRCLECGSPLSGRSGKIFCSLKCKNKFNNRKSRERQSYKRCKIKSISRNYNILEMLLKDGISTVEITELTNLGFDPSCLTGYRSGANRRAEFSCFDISYCQSERKVYGLKRLETTRVSVLPSPDPSNHR